MKHFDKATADPISILAKAIRVRLSGDVKLEASAVDLSALHRRVAGYEQLILFLGRSNLQTVISDTLRANECQAEIYDMTSLIEHGAWSMFFERLYEQSHG